MKNDALAHLAHYVERLREPENLFSGKRLPAGFALPDNVLVFFHNFTAPTANSHGRCTLVFPLDRMTYYVDGVRVELTPGDVLFVPPYATRFLHPASGGYRRLFITFDDPGPQSYLPEPGRGVVAERTWRELWRFLAKYREGGVEEMALELMNFLRVLQTAPRDPAPHALPPPLAKAIEFIESHLASRIGLKEIADHIGLSESHLRMLFRKEMGVSLGRFLTRKRLDAAQYRLLHSNMTPAEIASACGFANVYVFGAFFKKNTGTSPLKFRKSRGQE